MARELTLAYPGDLNTLTGGYIYDKRILAELQTLGWVTHTLSLDAQFPNVDDSTKQQAAQILSQVDPSHILVIDGLALGALGQHAQKISDQRPFIALVHHPLALESGIDASTARTLMQTERDALALAQSVIVTSNITKQTLIDQYGVPAANISVIEPGVDRPIASGGHQPSANQAPGKTTPSNAQPTPKTVRLLSVGALVPRKGFDVLIQALAQLSELDWHLTIVGDDQRAPSCTAHLRSLIEQHRLQDRIEMVGALPTEQLGIEYASADLFVLASRYEGYGMAYAEALAWGLPVIGTDGGAAAQTLSTPAAKVVAVNDIDALARALQSLMANPDKHLQMQQAARQHALSLPTWQASARQFAQAIE